MEISNHSGEPSEPKFLQKPNSKRVVAIFVIMFFSFYSFNFFGRFLLVEILLFIIFLVHMLEGKITPTTKRLKPLVGLLFLALISQIFVDMVSGNVLISMLKGFSLILFTITNLYGISILTNFRTIEVRVALLGYSLGGLASFILQPSTYARSEIWKFGIGYPLTLTVLVIISLPALGRYRFLPLVSLAPLSAISLSLGARSLALFTLLPLFFLRYIRVARDVNYFRIFRVVLIISIGILVFYSAYSKLAENGSLGVKAQSKYLAQTSSGGNIVINSRSELIFAARGIADSPILGHGSYAEMGPELQLKILNFVEKSGLYYDIAPLNKLYGNRIPVHSMVLQWWLWFGALGVLFPLRLSFLYFKSLKSQNREPVFYYLALSGLWNLFFSPYGETYRILIPLTIVVLLTPRKSPHLENGSDG